MNNIEIIHLSKQYSNGVIALDDISFTVGSGVFGLLGHNGAGKSTLMKALVTVLKPTLRRDETTCRNCSGVGWRSESPCGRRADSRT